MQFVPSFIVQWLKSQWHPKSWTFSGNFLVIYSLLFPMKTVYYFISIHFGIIMVHIIVYIIDFTHIKYIEELKITAIHKALSPIHKALNSGVWLELQHQGVLLRKALNREPRSRPLTCMCVCVWVAQSCLTLWHPMDCSPPGFSVHGILQARILKWIAIPYST